MKPHRILAPSPAAVLARAWPIVAMLLLVHGAPAASVVTNITTTFGAGTINNTANILTTTSNGGQVNNISVHPVAATWTGSGLNSYRGSAASGTPSVVSTILGTDVSTGASSDSSATTINAIFNQAVGTGGRLFIFDVSGGTSVESGWSVQAIVGGDENSPVLGGSLFGLPTTWGDTTKDLSGLFPAISFSFTQNIIGYEIDIADLGVSSLIGLRVNVPAGGDPSAILANPEPSRAVLLLLGFAGMVMRRRRA